MSTHPYIEFEGSELWQTVSDSICELEKNRDLKLTTNLNYVVGYLCKQLAAKELVFVKNKEWYRIVKVVGRPPNK